MSNVRVLDDAIRISKRLPVFPVQANKKPACPKGFKAASQDVSEIVELWKKYPAPLIGVPSGERSGIDILDVDPRNDGMVWFDEAKHSLPITRTHVTQSGGLHILFRHANGVKNSAGKIAPGIDVRGGSNGGGGGYFVYWPATGLAVENANILEDWPVWLLKIARPVPERKRILVPATSREAGTRAALMIDRAYERVRNAAPGQRHFQLRAAAATLGGLREHIGRTADQIESDLVALIVQTGAEDAENARRTVKWAFEKGAKSPLLNRA